MCLICLCILLLTIITKYKVNHAKLLTGVYKKGAYAIWNDPNIRAAHSYAICSHFEEFGMFKLNKIAIISLVEFHTRRMHLTK